MQTLSSAAWNRPQAPPFLAAPPQAAWDYLGNDGTTITLHTNSNAPRSGGCRGAERAPALQTASRCAQHTSGRSMPSRLSLLPACHCRYRVVRGDMAAPNFAASCTDLMAQHPKDLLQWCCLVKVRGRGGAGAGAGYWLDGPGLQAWLSCCCFPKPAVHNNAEAATTNAPRLWPPSPCARAARWWSATCATWCPRCSCTAGRRARWCGELGGGLMVAGWNITHS